MITIVDYGMGNLGSIVNMLKRVGADVAVASSAAAVSAADKLIIPGVGAFDHGMTGMNDGWIDVLNEAVLHRGVPVLGICLGMQLLCRSSEEGHLPGLGWIDAHVKRFRMSDEHNLKVPHMGWNTVTIVKPNPLIEVGQDEQRFYFVHSYHVVCSNPEDVLAVTDYGFHFAAAVSHENIFGVQFHPEKSHRFGMDLIKKFVEF
ncbi:MAG: imidazole glycerol phosphate synthase subunit HisH [Nitrosomonas ureae]